MSRPYLTPAEASPILGMSSDYIRAQMRRGLLPIGHALKSPGGKHWRFMIYPEMLSKFIGREIEIDHRSGS